ncbi:unnamed protein product [Brachionus calyciflorus]|uniref:Uncharacterized protein n=1 Tax=Brachionus calyciflorus TaxID=104777 RepID=A0A814ILN1_9BILA|nr:unnamed protein product [Brachionus calyciflorus]
MANSVKVDAEACLRNNTAALRKVLKWASSIIGKTIRITNNLKQSDERNYYNSKSAWIIKIFLDEIETFMNQTKKIVATESECMQKINETKSEKNKNLDKIKNNKMKRGAGHLDPLKSAKSVKYDSRDEEDNVILRACNMNNANVQPEVPIASYQSTKTIAKTNSRKKAESTPTRENRENPVAQKVKKKQTSVKEIKKSKELEARRNVLEELLEEDENVKEWDEE